jgi:hypothetical protein
LAVVEAEAEAAVVEELKPKRWKVKDTIKTRSSEGSNPLRRESSHPEV